MPTELALLAHDALAETLCGERLTAREAAAIAASANPRVRRRRLAGRVAAKHLLLLHAAEAMAEPADEAPRFVTLDAERIAAFSAERYREVELLPSDVPADAAPPRPTLRGTPLAARVSISHRGGLSCAAVGDDRAVGVDLEGVAARAAAFYRSNFTAVERRWVEAGARRAGLAAEWLYTFLWTVKEAALKSGATAVRSVWEFPQLEVTLPARLAEQLGAARGRALGERFTAFDATLAHAGRCTPARVQTTTTDEAILSLLTTAVEAKT